MNAQHTKGPWDVHSFNVNGTDTFEIHPIDDEHGEQVIADIPAECVGDREANARLIAAAPEGLTFAEHFREWFANHFEDFDSATNAQLLCLDNEAAAFVVKAKGE